MIPKAGPRRVLVRCDASQVIGGGHAMRCLALANELASAGASVTFATAAMPEVIERRIIKAGHRLDWSDLSPELERSGAGWERSPISAEAQQRDAEASGSATGPVNWVIVDHYLLDRHWHSAARRFAEAVLVIDDLANRSYDCDLLVDQSFGRSAAEYRGLVPSDARILAGATYALLRPEFASQRGPALARRKRPGPVERILVSMGTGDAHGVTAAVLDQALSAAPECAFDVILCAQSASLAAVRDLAARNSRISLHVDSDEMAKLILSADIAIGAPGTTSWERCCLGLPSILVELADNQRFVAGALERAGAALVAPTIGAIPELLFWLAGDLRLRMEMIAAAFAVTDGHGSARVANELLGVGSKAEEPPTLRPAVAGDSESIWLWRNDHQTRSASQSTAPVAWDVHDAWWREALESEDRHIFVAEANGVELAVVRFDALEANDFEVSINVAPWARGTRLGGALLEEACRAFRNERAGVTLSATIHRDNPASRRIFERIGFVRTATLSDVGFERYVLGEGMPDDQGN